MRTFSKKIYLFLSLVCFLISSLRGFACPCGCGSQRPLSLFPGERFRLQTSLKHKRFADYELLAGKKTAYLQRKTNSQSVYSFVARTFYDLELSFSGAFSLNWHPEAGHDLAVADPSLALSYSFWYPFADFLNLEQVALSFAFKPAFAKGMKERSEKEAFLDVHGSGVREYLLSSDFSFVLKNYHLSLSSSLIYKDPLAILTDSTKSSLQQGLTRQASLALSYNWMGIGSLGLREEFESSLPDFLDGEEITGSAAQKWRTSLSWQLQVGIRKTLSLTVEEEAYLIPMKNALPASSVSLAYTQAI